MTEELQGRRLAVLRDLKCLTQTQLADSLAVTQSFLSLVERGQRPLSMALCHIASQQFHVPISFFAAPSGPTDSGVFTFRKHASASVRDERRVTAQFSEAARLFWKVSQLSDYRSANLPESTVIEHDAELGAEEIRRSVGLGTDAPVRNVTRLLEKLGVGVVVNLDDSFHEASKHTGLSRPSVLNHRPLVATAGPLPGAVQRLTLAHELGHLIFDAGLTTPMASTRSVEERRAFRFAGALLLPEHVARRRITESMNLQSYLRIKADYGISALAVIRRAHDLGIISDGRYRSLSIQASSQGWRRDEPVVVQREEPSLFRQSLERAMGPNPVPQASDRFGVEPSLIRRWAALDLIQESLGIVIDFDARRRLRQSS